MLDEAAPPFQLPLDWVLVRLLPLADTFCKDAFIHITFSLTTFAHKPEATVPLTTISEPTMLLITLLVMLFAVRFPDAEQPPKSGVSTQLSTSLLLIVVLV